MILENTLAEDVSTRQSSLIKIHCFVSKAKLRYCQADPAPLDLSSCSQDWVKDGRKAYFFSKVEGNWNSSQSFCSSCSGSLVAVENAQEMVREPLKVLISSVVRVQLLTSTRWLGEVQE